MAGKTRPSLRAKTLQNVDHSNLSLTDKECIHQVFKAFEELNNADVVEVVRCEKCEYLEHTSNHIPYCKRMDEYSDGDILYEVCYDDFCSYGKRK